MFSSIGMNIDTKVQSLVVCYYWRLYHRFALRRMLWCANTIITCWYSGDLFDNWLLRSRGRVKSNPTDIYEGIMPWERLQRWGMRFSVSGKNLSVFENNADTWGSSLLSFAFTIDKDYAQRFNFSRCFFYSIGIFLFFQMGPPILWSRCGVNGDLLSNWI